MHTNIHTNIYIYILYIHINIFTYINKKNKNTHQNQSKPQRFAARLLPPPPFFSGLLIWTKKIPGSRPLFFVFLFSLFLLRVACVPLLPHLRRYVLHFLLLFRFLFLFLCLFLFLLQGPRCGCYAARLALFFPSLFFFAPLCFAAWARPAPCSLLVFFFLHLFFFLADVSLAPAPVLLATFFVFASPSPPSADLSPM